MEMESSESYDKRSGSMYPFYEIGGSSYRHGIHRFLFLTLEEYNQLGRDAAITLEYGRIRAKRISTDPDAKRKAAEYRAEYRRRCRMPVQR